MTDDYPKNKYTVARKKLRRAIKKCGKRRCSPEVRSRLYRSLGVVYLGLGRKKQASGAFEKAVELDPTGRLESEVATPEVSAAFRRAGGEVEEPEPEPEPESASVPEPGDDESQDPKDSAPTDDTEDNAGKDGGSSSWLSLSMQQDWMLYSASRPVCGDVKYGCLASDGEYQGPIWSEQGNKVSSGLALATTRVMLGFEQVIGDNFSLGLRLGFAFRGGPTLSGGDKFLPLHAELRSAYYFGDKPFADSGVRPYFAVGGGLAEVRSRVDVDLYPDAAAYNEARKQTVDAWRAAGRVFVAPTIGTQFAFTPTFTLTLELRWMVLLGTSGSAPAASIGFAQGL